MGFPLIENRAFSEVNNTTQVINLAYPRPGSYLKQTTPDFTKKNFTSGARYNKVFEFPYDGAGDDYVSNAAVGIRFTDKAIGGISNAQYPSNLLNEYVLNQSSRFLKPTIGTNTTVGDYTVSFSDNRLYILEIVARANTASSISIVDYDNDIWSWGWYTSGTSDTQSFNYDKEIIMGLGNYSSTGQKYNAFKVRKVWLNNMGISSTITGTTSCDFHYAFASKTTAIPTDIPQLAKITLISSTLSPADISMALTDDMSIPTAERQDTGSAYAEMFRIDLASTATKGLEICTKLGLRVSSGTYTNSVNFEFSEDNGITWVPRNGNLTWNTACVDYLNTNTTAETIFYDRFVVFDKITNIRINQKVSTSAVAGYLKVYYVKAFDLAPAVFTPSTYAGPATPQAFDGDLTTYSSIISTNSATSSAAGFLVASWDMGPSHYNRGVNENGYISKPLMKFKHVTNNNAGRLYFWGSPDNSTWYNCTSYGNSGNNYVETPQGIGSTATGHVGSYKLIGFNENPGDFIYRYGRCTLWSSSTTQSIYVAEIGFLF